MLKVTIKEIRSSTETPWFSEVPHADRDYVKQKLRELAENASMYQKVNQNPSGLEKTITRYFIDTATYQAFFNDPVVASHREGANQYNSSNAITRTVEVSEVTNN